MYIVYRLGTLQFTSSVSMYILLREQQKLYKINIYYKRILYKTYLH